MTHRSKISAAFMALSLLSASTAGAQDIKPEPSGRPSLASNLGYSDKRGMLASELFMRDYYQKASELHQFSKSFLLKAAGSRGGSKRYSAPRFQVPET